MFWPAGGGLEGTNSGEGGQDQDRTGQKDRQASR